MAQPNILLITTDQQRFDTLHAAGNPCIRTPHLNWLADTGIHFTSAYSDCPLCIPARATIMTGRHGYSLGLTRNREDVRPIESRLSLPGILAQAGYQTRAVGKMHFAPMRCHYGFEHMELLEDYYRTMKKHPHLGVPMDHGMGQNEMEPAINTVSETGSLTHWTVERSVDFLETRDETRPFFLWTSFAKPHPPFDPCRTYWELYANADVPEPIHGNWSERIEAIPEGFLQSTRLLNNVHRFSRQVLQDIRRAYYACITQIDYNLGLLFARMREMGLFQNTLILFTSDHGEMLGDHHMGAKSVFFEGSAHVPLLVRMPGEVDDDPRRGIRCGKLACLADVLPTCLGFAGVEKPAGLEIDGLDLLDLAGAGAGRSALFGECEHYHMILDGRYKYTFTSVGPGELLFDLEKDPLEQRDLIRCNEAGDVLDRLKRMLTERLGRAGHEAVQEGRLVATEKSAGLDKVGRNPWPGFHSRDFPADVLH